jgi:HAD superfamily hydrolase (TIGR01459 family)
MHRPRHATLSELINGYDVFFVDQFGVLRDDGGPYEGAIEAISHLKAAGKLVVILSNSGRSGDFNADRLVKIGFAQNSFDHFVTSGDVAFDILSRPGAGLPANSKCLTVSSGGDSNLADRLRLTATGSARDADVVIISGSEAEHVPMDDYREMLRPAAERGLPCYCTNPDIHKLHKGSIAPGAGSIARLYEEIGGTVVWLGKPYPEIYEHARRLVGDPNLQRVVCVGDSIEHDILGAKTAGLDSVLVRTGILAKNDRAELDELMSKAGAFPTFIMSALRI